MSEPVDIEKRLEESGALRRGHFQLSSGLHSSAYVQCALLLELPARAREVGTALAEKLKAYGIESILSPALGGVIIGHEVAAALGAPFRFAERKGTELEIRRGFALRPGEKVAIIEDVVTTGKSTLETARLAESAGAQVVAVGAIIDRTAGAHPFAAVPFASLLELRLPAFKADACPLCAAGGVAEKPGSRPRVGAG
ncbi:MAG TPA: orotate phosphoribosyltransferase [Thermoanaerobaculia bacterium]|nr:orotate phosphoribosyltransferase [Thermoanaerobaculia bacterium]